MTDNSFDKSLQQFTDFSKNTMIRVLSSDSLSESYFLTYRNWIDAKPADMTAEYGGVLFFLAHHLSTRAQYKKYLEKVNQILTSSYLVSYFRFFYDIPHDMGLDRLQLHATGTTSLIFVAHTSLYGRIALKVIQAPYITNINVRQSTRLYCSNYSMHTRYSPDIYNSSDTWIAMAFIEGKNLHEYWLDTTIRERDLRSADDIRNLFKHIISELAEALKYYSDLKPAISHGDLNPFNIIINGGSSPMLTLIDFGPNYVLKERLGNRHSFVETIGQTELFIAPEILEEDHGPSVTSDLYSFGLIILYLLSNATLRKETIGANLRQIWQMPELAGIAGIIEDLIESDQKYRAIVLNNYKTHNDGVGAFFHLNLAFKSQMELLSLTKTGILGDSAGGESQIFSIKLDVFDSMRLIYRSLKIGKTPYTAISNYQLASAQINLFCQICIIISAASYSIADFAVKFPLINAIHVPQLVGTILHYTPNWFHQFTVGDISGNIPGRLVALTFGLVASRYYANIFSTINLIGCRGTICMLCTTIMRVNSFSYFMPIMLAIVVNPKWWPFCAMAGTFFPFLNNALCAFVANKARQISHPYSTIEKQLHAYETSRFSGVFREWWLLMMLYCLSFGGIGILLYSSVARDELIYSALYSLINMAKIWRNNCGKDAPFIAGNLKRLFFALKRHNLRSYDVPGQKMA